MKSLFHFIYIYSILLLSIGIAIFPTISFIFSKEAFSPYILISSFILLLFSIGLSTKQLHIPNRLYFKVFIIFACIISISYLFHHDNTFANRKYLLFLSNGLLLTFFSSSINNDKFNLLANGIFFFSIIQSFIILIFAFYFNDLSILSWVFNSQLKIDIILISRILGLGIIISFFKHKHIYSILFVAYLFYLMLVLNEIGPIIGVLFTLLIYYIRKYPKHILLLIPLSIILYFSIILYIPDLGLSQIAKDPRVQIYITNISYFFNNPLIGIGIAGHSQLFGNYQSAHNIFIEIASEYGLLGLLPFIIMIILLIKKFIKSNNLWGYIWLYTFIIVQFSGDISTNSLFWMFSSFLVINKYYIPINQRLQLSNGKV